MKITGHESATLNIPEDDPLANMPEEAGRTRPIVILRLRTDAGIEGIGVTLWGGHLTGSLRAAVDELAALTLGEDPLRFVELGLVAALRLFLTHDTPQVDVDHERRLAAGTGDFEFRLEPRHHFFPPSAPATPLN